MTTTDFSSHKVGLKLKDMCAYMGISDDERHLFWVAELALLAKLPPYWKQVFATCVPPVSACSSSASTYLRTTGWHLAVPLYCVTKRLKLCRLQYKDEEGHAYFHNHATNVTSWTHPRDAYFLELLSREVYVLV